MNVGPYAYVMAKKGKVQLLQFSIGGTETAAREDVKKIDELKKQGWAHTATINPAAIVERILNNAEGVKSQIKELKGLK